MASAAKYVQEDGADVDTPSTNVSAEAGRRCVKNIRQYPILSTDWIQLVESFKQLCRLVMVEGRMTPNTKVSEAVGRNTDGGTLWDQEAYENAIRILVEEAKVNLCLRLIHDYKTWQYNTELKKKTLQDVKNSYGYPEAHLEEQMRAFEESLGMLLARAFMHVETLQLMDIPLLIQHIAVVLDTVVKQGESEAAKGTKLQETIVLYYFSSLMTHAEKLNNGEVLAKLKELSVVPLLIRHIKEFSESYSFDLKKNVAEGLSALIGNEDFDTDWKGFFPHPGDLPDFKLLEEKIANPVLQQQPEVKKDIRPFLDFFKRLQRAGV